MAHDCSSYQIKLPYITLPLEYNITYYFDGFVQRPAISGTLLGGTFHVIYTRSF